MPSYLWAAAVGEKLSLRLVRVVPMTFYVANDDDIGDGDNE